MTENRRLGRCTIVAFVTIVNVDKARSFYRDTLGLTLLREEPPFALIFDANGIMLRLVIASERPPIMGTVLGWDVSEISESVRELESAGVRFERYGNMKQDEQGIWTSPNGAKVAWLRDPDGNVLGLTEYPGLRR
jgi:catechol 2,3-dioxygenase-like lactoylglutathione lyase family enzyme